MNTEAIRKSHYEAAIKLCYRRVSRDVRWSNVAHTLTRAQIKSLMGNPSEAKALLVDARKAALRLLEDAAIEAARC